MEDRRAFLAAALATALFLVSIRSFVSSVYFLNLEVLELNETAAYTLLLLAPLLLVLSPLFSRSGSVLVGAAGTMAVGGVLTVLAGTAGATIALAGLTSAAYLVILPLLLHLGRGVPVAAGLALALAFDVARLVAGDGAGPFGQNLRMALLALMGVVLFALVIIPGRAPVVQADAVLPRATFLAGLGFGAWLFLQTHVWGSAHHIARWNEVPAVAVGGGMIIGLVLGAALVMHYASRPPKTYIIVVAQLLPVILLLDHTILHSAALPVTLLLGQTVLVVDLAILLGVLARSPLRTVAVGLGAGMALFVALLFMSVFAYTFAYVPFGDLWEGRAGVFLLLGVMVALGASLWLFVRTRLESPRAFPRLPGDRRLVAVLLALPLAVGVIGTAIPDASVEPPEGRGLRVVSYNVHQGFNDNGVLDVDLFVRIMKDLDADLVSLQESDTPRITSGNIDIVDVLASRLGYHAYYGPPTRAQSFGVAILSRNAIQETFLRELPSDSDNRYLAGARIAVDGADIWFFAIHMGLPQPDREAQIDAILTHAGRLGGPRILAGDFNSCPQGLCPGNEDSPDTVYEQVTATYQDSWTAAGHQRDDPAGHTYSAADPVRRIDHIFVTSGFDVQQARVDRSSAAVAASDHLPAVAEITLSV